MTFRGWPSEALEFHEALSADNSKTFWTPHKEFYERQVHAPMVELDRAAKNRIVDFLRTSRPLRQWLDVNVGPSSAPR